MAVYGYTNEAGEPIMDAAAYRYEQQLDSEYYESGEYLLDREDDYDGEADGDEFCDADLPDGSTCFTQLDGDGNCPDQITHLVL